MALILDTGPLIAALDRDDRHHEACAELMDRADEPLVVPAPVLPEVDYLAGRSLGPSAMPAFLRDIVAGAYRLAETTVSDLARAAELCETYADLRVGFVDAAVLALTERMGEAKLVTLDHRHFSVMRPRHSPALRLLP